MKKLFLISGLLVAIVSSACKKNEPEDLSYAACMQAQSPSKDFIFNYIQGKWILTEEFCSYCTTPTSTPTSRNNYTLTFNSDSSVIGTSDDLIVPARKFSIEADRANPGKYFIQINESTTSYQLDGYIFICGDKIGLASGYPSGPTMIYTRVSK
jgi:hypothetical protein